MKIALVHDYIKEYGGAERVLEVLSDLFPEAKIYTSIYHPQSLGPHRARLEKKWQGRVVQSWFKYIPFAHKLISPLRVLSPLAFYLLKIENCLPRQSKATAGDLIITSATGAYFPNALNKKNSQLICYCHTPPRYLYGYPTARKVTNKYLLFLVDIINHFLRLFDFKFSQNVDQYIANSREVAARIKKFYKKDAVVIHPPIDLQSVETHYNASQKAKNSLGDYYLCGGRLAHAKRFDLAIEAAIILGFNLKIFGRDFGGNANHLKSLAKGHKNIEFLGEVDTPTRNLLFAKAKAFINPGRDEDFGMTLPEAMALGCPVIAHSSGGPAETVISGKTGILFQDHSLNGLINTIKLFEKTMINRQDCIKQSKKFDQKVFEKKVLSLVNTFTPN